MGLSFWHLVVVLVVVLIVFGAGKLPTVMGDLGKGIKNFKEGLNGDPEKQDKPFLTDQEKDDDTKPKA